MKVRVLSLVVALMVAALPAVALAAKPAPLNATAGVAVTSMSDPIPAGRSGRARIELETLQGLILDVQEGPQDLAGALLAMEQHSNELFSSSDPATAVALDGSSKGTFTVVHPLTGEVLATGQYHLNVSNQPGCQVYNEGRWSTTGGSPLKGRGTVTACLNSDVWTLQTLQSK